MRVGTCWMLFMIEEGVIAIAIEAGVAKVMLLGFRKAAWGLDMVIAG